MDNTSETPRDWGVIAVTTTVLGTADRQVAEEMAADVENLTVISRVPGGQWQPVSSADGPTRCVFLVEAEMQVGTLTDYSKHWEAAHYSGGHVSPYVCTWGGAAFTVGVEHLGTSEDSWMRYRLSVGDDTVFVTLDGRA
ncbi:hypothetical protein [Streptomyces cavernae]|uniref:hypothetical protein n=1 Tax=Streptomyces cavernae TaxID=2259034 RepID=UPI001EE3FB1B|nr:hypothetical protein [Streptomyces cavernae]